VIINADTHGEYPDKIRSSGPLPAGERVGHHERYGMGTGHQVFFQTGAEQILRL
jgi:hypothetical protein